MSVPATYDGTVGGEVVTTCQALRTDAPGDAAIGITATLTAAAAGGTATELKTVDVTIGESSALAAFGVTVHCVSGAGMIGSHQSVWSLTTRVAQCCCVQDALSALIALPKESASTRHQQQTLHQHLHPAQPRWPPAPTLCS